MAIALVQFNLESRDLFGQQVKKTIDSQYPPMGSNKFSSPGDAESFYYT